MKYTTFVGSSRQALHLNARKREKKINIEGCGFWEYWVVVRGEQNSIMEDFEKKVSIKEPMESDEAACSSSSSKIVHLLRSFLAIQQRRAQAYAKLKRYFFSSPMDPMRNSLC